MGAVRITGENGTTIAGVTSGDQSSSARVPYPATVVTYLEAEKDGELNGGFGLGEELSTQRLDSVTEDAEDLGYSLSSLEKCSKVSESSTLLLSTILESDAILGHATLSPVKSSKRLPDSSECASEVGIDSLTPDKQSKQLKVFRRRESPSSKTTKSWVVERVSWIGGRGCDMTTEVLSGKNHNSCLDYEKLTTNVLSMLAEHEEQGLLGGMGNQENETPGVGGTESQLEGEIAPEEQLDQEMVSVSPASKDLKLVWKVKGTAGMSWDGQEGKLKQDFGQIVAAKYREGATSSLREEVDGFMGMKDDDITYEA
jgi:hypothetical protein